MSEQQLFPRVSTNYNKDYHSNKSRDFSNKSRGTVYLQHLIDVRYEIESYMSCNLRDVMAEREEC